MQERVLTCPVRTSGGLPVCSNAGVPAARGFHPTSFAAHTQRTEAPNAVPQKAVVWSVTAAMTEKELPVLCKKPVFSRLSQFIADKPLPVTPAPAPINNHLIPLSFFFSSICRGDRCDSAHGLPERQFFLSFKQERFGTESLSYESQNNQLHH